ncbi:hypothetical protein INS49_003693 [Diaporthe citri]|uniref:uncharacterized protein n=1 Tax=Diaporthe citri TaxID=83186 RepID=UPI001C805D77|nr:uncharacterized protein INS49_003693 [Diaporthe citri]KAG6355729.1 hypothetical protein INS49_003693 [Diaporthe citri]
MPLGGSVTFGSGSSHANGYREKLRQLLIDNGYTIEMVGSRRSGSLSNNHNEGWRGIRIDQIHNKAQKSIPWLRPNVVTINAGSNDCIQRFEIDSIGKRMDRLLKMTWDASPRSTIILSTLLPTSDTSVEAKILQTNARYRDLAEKKTDEGRRIALVDMHNAAGPNLDDLVDGVHPNDLGYQKMALLWYEGIQDCAARGLIEEPT